ncbi:hypothetical protein Tco_0856843 [Tanacetum coccineum]|uniref:Uncharacterized protein n=1 Tax=Tanacetum coccineum TaxID=301880 RepID=A0ABQ5B4K0_9ASTR
MLQYSVSHADDDVDNFKRCCTSYTFDVRYRVLRALLLHRSSINNSASLKLLEYMDVHDNDASESSQPSWGKIVYVEEVVYFTSLSMVKVIYYAYARRIVADFLHVPSERIFTKT